jgi:signal transduction histidine kinase
LGRVQRILEDARQDGLTETEYRQVVESSADGITSILDMFGAILRISQIESGDRRSGFRKLDLSGLVTDACETFSPAFEEDGKSLDHDVSPGIEIYGDPELLTLSLSNLLENANQHAPDGTRIRVNLRKVNGLVELVVCDNGEGVPALLREKIFERFFRVDASRATSGNGLGLSIVAAVADLHAGKVFAEDNKPGLRIGMSLQPA